MSDQEINIAIAEVRGLLGPWTEQITPCGCDGQWDLFNSDGVRLPDCCNDLNAMHEAEETLTLQQLVDMQICITHFEGILPFHSTAHQRAKAFLRAIGKWKEAAK